MNFGIGVLYGWIFVLLFGASNLILMKVYPKHYTKRLLTLPTFTNLQEKVPSVIYALLLNLTMLMACFLPIMGGALFFVGLIIYSLSLFCVIIALRAYARTEPNKPVTEGIYKLSRHPQQVFTCTMLVGIGLMLANPIIIASGILQLFLIYPSLLVQERFCVEKYGADYIKYLSVSPRYFLIF